MILAGEIEEVVEQSAPVPLYTLEIPQEKP
jgi:hypothetical protein